MNNLLNALFPQGKRKLLVSLIALVVGLGLEKFGGGLSENMMVSLIAIVGIFTGGNVGEHLADALKVFRGTKVGQIIEDILPGDQGLGEDKVDTAYYSPPKAAVASEQDLRINELENKLVVQSQNISQIVNLLNTMRQAQQPGRPQ